MVDPIVKTDYAGMYSRLGQSGESALKTTGSFLEMLGLTKDKNAFAQATLSELKQKGVPDSDIKQLNNYISQFGKTTKDVIGITAPYNAAWEIYNASKDEATKTGVTLPPPNTIFGYITTDNNPVETYKSNIDKQMKTVKERNAATKTQQTATDFQEFQKSGQGQGTDFLSRTIAGGGDVETAKTLVGQANTQQREQRLGERELAHRERTALDDLAKRTQIDNTLIDNLSSSIKEFGMKLERNKDRRDDLKSEINRLKNSYADDSVIKPIEDEVKRLDEIIKSDEPVYKDSYDKWNTMVKRRVGIKTTDNTGTGGRTGTTTGKKVWNEQTQKFEMQ